MMKSSIFMVPPTHTQNFTTQRPEVSKHGNYYMDSPHMSTSTCASYLVLFIKQLAVTLGNQLLICSTSPSLYHK